MSRASAAAVVLASVMAAQSAVVAQEVGRAAAVNQDAAKSGQVLAIGAAVIHKERIVTNAHGATQLLFIDQTTLSVGPNSDLVIDEYVFDPDKGVGKMTASLAKGAMRFIGGQITHNGSASVNTPPATIGIRGGVVDISTDGTSTKASNSYGTVTFTPTSGNTSPVNVPQGSTGASNGSGGASVTPTTQQQAGSTNALYQSKGAQSGGASPATSQSAADASAKNTTTTSSIATTSSPAAGSTAAGPSSTTQSGTSGGGAGPGGAGLGASNPSNPATWFNNTNGPPSTTPPGTGGGGSSLGGNTQSRGGTPGGGGGK